MKPLIFILLFINPLQLFAQNEVFINCSNGALIRLNVQTCNYQIVGTLQGTFADIAYSPITGRLYALSSYNIYEIDTSNASTISTTSTSTGYTNLTCDENGILYLVNSQNDLITVSPWNGNAWTLGNTNSDYYAAGDIVFFDGYLYYSGNRLMSAGPGPSGGLIKVDPNDISNSELIPFSSNVYALATVGCEPAIYKFKGTSVYRLEPPNFTQQTLVCSLPSGYIADGAAEIWKPTFYEFGFEEDTTTLCSITDSTFVFDLPGASYLWHDGSMDSSYYTNQVETIWVEVTWNECFYQDTTVIQFGQNPVVDLGPDTLLCEGEQTQLDAYYPNASYFWQDSTLSPQYNVTQPNTYWVDVTATNCTVRDSIMIDYNMFDVDNLPEDQDVCFDDVLELNVGTQGANYLWQDFSTSPAYIVEYPGQYFVDVNYGPCFWTDTIDVEFIDCVVAIDMPNVFTPNADGINDVFMPTHVNAIKSAKLTITNRWGNVVFQTTDLNQGWNGNSDGKKCPEGVYTYVIRYEDDYDKFGSKNGFVQLIR